MRQIELNFDPGLVDRFPEFMQCVKAAVYGCGKPFKAVAADLDMSSSRLSRMFNEADENLNFPLHRLPELIAATGDRTPILWLVEYFLQDPGTKKAQAIEQLATLLPQIQKLLKSVNE